MLNHTQRIRYLYKTILKLHSGLPAELKSIGDQYVKAEFRRHKQASQDEIALFEGEWSRYAMALAEQLGLRGPHSASHLGQHLKENQLNWFSDEQLLQLYELKAEVSNVYKNTESKTPES